MRRYLAAGIWLAMTFTATLIVWAAVSVVAADVTDRPAPVVAHRDVVVALAGSPGSTGSAGTPASGSATATSSTTTTTTSRSVAPTPPATAATRSPAHTGKTTGPAVTAASTTTAPSIPPTTKAPSHPNPPPTTTVPAPGGGTATYSNDGGTVAVACTGFSSIRLVAALPNDGFQAIVFSGGPFFVQVNFVGQGENFPISAACVFNQPFQGNKDH